MDRWPRCIHYAPRDGQSPLATIGVRFLCRRQAITRSIADCSCGVVASTSVNVSAAMRHTTPSRSARTPAERSSPAIGSLYLNRAGSLPAGRVVARELGAFALSSGHAYLTVAVTLGVVAIVGAALATMHGRAIAQS